MKKILFFICLIIFIVSVAGVSASDDANQAIYDNSNNEDILAISSSENSVVGAEPNGVGTFQELQDKIDAVVENGTINLDKNYTWNGSFKGDGITISKPITINGNGYVIDGLSAVRIFNVTATSGVVLDNIIFKGGSFKGVDTSLENYYNGGAIYFYDISNSTVSNCIFDNNVASSGGAISALSSINNNFTNLTFVNNSAVDSVGGAIFVRNLENCTFINITSTNNRAADDGGSFYIKGKFNKNTFKDSKFTNNSAEGVDDVGFGNGGAFYVYCESEENSFENIIFENNSAKTCDGGAINFLGKVTDTSFDNVLFINNSAVNSFGGAINIDGGIEGCTFNNTLFIDNTAFSAGAISFNKIASSNLFENTAFISNVAENNGGAINNGLWSYTNFENNKFKKVLFANNTAENNGGALYVNGNTILNTFEYVAFINNTAKSMDGGAINFCLMVVNNTFDHAVFINNTAKGDNGDAEDTVYSNGGAINLDYEMENCIFNNTVFVNNTAADNGGVLYVKGESTSVTFENVAFINNTAETEDGGAINFFSEVEDTLFENVIFYKNSAANMGGAINNDHGTENCTFRNALFIDNAAVKSGGALSLNALAYSNTFENMAFINNTAKKGEGGAIKVGAYYYTYFQENTFKNIIFANNSAFDSGGALHIYGNISVNYFENMIFAYNSVEIRDGGAINFYRDIWNATFDKVIFYKNRAANMGGAINADFELSNCTFNYTAFVDNTAGESGGALAINTPSKLNTFQNTAFINNSANNNGGAVYIGSWTYSTFEENIMENVAFINNSANNGGAFGVNGDSLSNIFQKTAFINNTGENVIYVVKSENDVIQDSLFINNENNKITLESGSIQMTDDWFGNNATNYNEEPDVNYYMDNWLFLNATATPNAIAINETSTVTFKLYSYNKGNVEEYDGPINVLLGLSSTLGSLNQSYALLGEDILYNASESGNGSVTGKFENAYYTIVLKNKEITEINVTNDTIELEIDTESETGATLIPSEAGNLTYTSSNESVAVVDNGKIIALNEGTATITVSFEGNDDYAPAENKTIFVTVKDSYRNITAEELIKLYGNPKPFVVNVTNSRGKAVAGETVSITINGVTYNKTTDENGTVSLNINLPSGDYPVNITVGNYTADSYVYIMPTITGEDVESEFKNVTYTVYVWDSEGQFLENGTAVECNINGVIYTAYVNGDIGRASVNLILNGGNYTITATNPVTDEKTSNTIVIDNKDLNVSVSGDEITVGEEAVVTIFGLADATGNITLSFNGEDYPFNIVADIMSIAIPNLFENTTVTVSYPGDYRYNNFTVSADIIVNRIDSNITVMASDAYEGEIKYVYVRLPSYATGNVTLILNGEIRTVDIESAEFFPMDGYDFMQVPYENLTVGNYTITAIYNGDEFFSPSNATTTFVISPKENVTMNIDVSPVAEGQNVTIKIELPYDAIGNVTATVDGKNFTAYLVHGNATIIIPDLAAGNYTVPIYYTGNFRYNPITMEVNVTVEGNKSDIVSAPDVTKYFSGPESFVLIVTDYEGNPLANKSVTIVINGRSYNRTTDENGTASIALGLNSGVYNVTSIVDNQTVNSLVIILPTVNGTDIVKVFRNATQYYATFHDGEGKYLADGTTVKFNINGVMYERKVSGDEGLAKLNINLPAGEYIITAINLETGEMLANKITVISTIVENRDITKYYRNATQYTVKLLGADGNPVGAGENVTFNINGVFYTRQTNESGIAKLNINLQPGDYVITAQYNGCSVANNITVLPVLTADDFAKQWGTPDPFEAKLVDGQGKPYGEQKIEFNINGVFYNRYTDSNGIAKLNINLMPGEYIITSSYNGTNIANKITIVG